MNSLINQLRVPFFTVFFIFLFFYIFSFMFGPLPISIKATSNDTNQFSVSGEGKVAASTNGARVSLGVTKTASTADSAKNEMNQIANRVVADLKSLGIKEKDIKTSNLNVNPNYDFTRGQTITGYTASQNLDVKAETIELANQAIDIATKDGANNVGGVSFELTDEDRAKLEEKARDEAIKDAKQKASNIAKAAGIRLGKIVNIQVNTGGSQPPMYLESKAVDNTGGEPTRIQPGENTVIVSVTLSFETL